MRSCKLVGLLLLGALLLPPCIARAEEISIPAVEYDISGWEDIWREIQVETGGAAGGASVSDAIARIKEGNLDGLLDLGRIGGLFKEKLTEGVKGMLGIIAAAFFSAAAGAAVGTQKGVGEMLSFCLTGLCISVAAACVCAQMKEAQRVIDGVAQLGELVSPALMVMIAAAGGSAVSAVQPTSVLLCSGMTEAFRNTFMPFILMMRAVHSGYGQREQAAQGNGWADKEPFEMGHGADVHLLSGQRKHKEPECSGTGQRGGEGAEIRL